MREHDPFAGSVHGDLDRLVHEPARLRILGYLHAVESADFLFLMQQTQLTQGNLSSHMSKLEAAGYIEVVKSFVDKRPRTLLRLTPAGRTALEAYMAQMRSLLDEVDSRQAPRASRSARPSRLRPRPVS